MKKYKLFRIFAILFFIISINSVLGIESNNFQNSTHARQALDTAILDLQDYEQQGLSTVRMSDIIIEAEQIYIAQSALEKINGTPNFKLVYEAIDKITTIKNDAYAVDDELSALRGYLDSDGQKLNLSEAEFIYTLAVDAFHKERYDDSLKLIDSTYQKVSEIESSSTATAVIYKAASETLTNFFKKYYRAMLIWITFIFAVYYLIHRKLMSHFLLRKIWKLIMEKTSLDGLIQETQKEFFQDKTMAEESYHVRTNKYKEMIRDINRQIYMTKEEFELMHKGHKLQK
jgi:hypothetical protein